MLSLRYIVGEATSFAALATVSGVAQVYVRSAQRALASIDGVGEPLAYFGRSEMLEALSVMSRSICTLFMLMSSPVSLVNLKFIFATMRTSLMVTMPLLPTDMVFLLLMGMPLAKSPTWSLLPAGAYTLLSKSVGRVVDVEVRPTSARAMFAKE